MAMNISDGEPLLQSSNRSEEKCRLLSSNWTHYSCPPLFDRISCWPGSFPNTLVVIPCFEEFRGIKYDTSQNASRVCHNNGTWAEKANYKDCQPLITKEVFGDDYPDYSHSIYFVGYGISLFVLLIAFTIFVSFQEMRCLRNKIHINLFITYILSNFFWILTSSFQTWMTSDDGATLIWCISMVLLRYFHLCTFFWMFVEGLYLFIQVIATFAIESTGVKLRHYLLVGWGTPLAIVVLWSTLLANSPFPPSMLEETWVSNDQEHELEPILTTSQAVLSCPFINKNSYEWVYTGPVILILCLNTFFLIWIMWVVITKLRSPTSTTDDHHHQHWKAAKALLVIIPLLGITYLITIYAPDDGSLTAVIFQHLRAFLLSTQGFAVTLPYCFLNTEVRTILKTHWERWKTTRSIREQNGPRNSITLATYYSCESRKNSLKRTTALPIRSHCRQTNLPTTTSEAGYTTKATMEQRRGYEDDEEKSNLL